MPKKDGSVAHKMSGEAARKPLGSRGPMKLLAGEEPVTSFPSPPPPPGDLSWPPVSKRMTQDNGDPDMGKVGRKKDLEVTDTFLQAPCRVHGERRTPVLWRGPGT
ncbi:hypothetical protein NDU88_004271 [Pleurodeles waltl]|uniref:Uncharacterized protein n=1 Tax=Pleurodeles waltl TaxID=8319 RepID=A0AAV7SIG2_PLEWA|nr:hypothetical protein NDU88_004271 [Pleurodeles waltl]